MAFNYRKDRLGQIQKDLKDKLTIDKTSQGGKGLVRPRTLAAARTQQGNQGTSGGTAQGINGAQGVHKDIIQETRVGGTVPERNKPNEDLLGTKTQAPGPSLSPELAFAGRRTVFDKNGPFIGGTSAEVLRQNTDTPIVSYDSIDVENLGNRNVLAGPGGPADPNNLTGSIANNVAAYKRAYEAVRDLNEYKSPELENPGGTFFTDAELQREEAIKAAEAALGVRGAVRTPEAAVQRNMSRIRRLQDQMSRMRHPKRRAAVQAQIDGLRSLQSDYTQRIGEIYGDSAEQTQRAIALGREADKDALGRANLALNTQKALAEQQLSMAKLGQQREIAEMKDRSANERAMVSHFLKWQELNNGTFDDFLVAISKGEVQGVKPDDEAMFRRLFEQANQ